ncbi:terpene synthase family protein [Streptomyces xiamenensis]
MSDTPGLADYAHAHLGRLFGPARPHPDAAALETDVRQWAVHVGLYREGDVGQLDRRRIGHLVGHCMPDASLPVARLTARYLAWVFVFDDIVAEDAPRLREHLALDLPGLLRDGTPVPVPAPSVLPGVLAAVRREIVECGGTALLPTLATALRQYLQACAREAPWREQGHPPSLGDYLHDRTHTAGGHPLYLQRLIPGMPGPAENLPPALTGLAELAFLLGGLANDLLGHAAEQESGDPVNVVTVLAHEYALTPAEAYRTAVVLHAGHKHRFDTDCAALAADPRLNPSQRRFTDAVAGWVLGSAAAIEPYWHHARTRRHT